MKKLIVASAIIFSTGITATSFAAATVKEKNTLGTADRTAAKKTPGIEDGSQLKIIIIDTYPVTG